MAQSVLYKAKERAAKRKVVLEAQSYPPSLTVVTPRLIFYSVDDEPTLTIDGVDSALIETVDALDFLASASPKLQQYFE